MVVAQVTKPVAFAYSETDIVLDAMVICFALPQYRHLSIIHSAIHGVWIWKYCTTLETRIRYTPTALFETFPFPSDFEPNRIEDDSHRAEQASLRERLDSLGRALDEARRQIMLRLDIGLTKLYNLYHTPDLDAVAIKKESKCSDTDADWAVPKILVLRDIHKAIDESVRDAYGWNDLPLQHGFHELEFLPEGDRVRYTISNDARRMLLRELLALNHKRHAEEVAAGLVDEKGKVIKKKEAGEKPKAKRERKKKDEGKQSEMFA